MTYVGKKPADIIATAVDTTTGTFSGDLTVDTSTLYVDSANNRVMIGTTTEGNSSADDLTVASTGQTGITIRSGTSSSGAIYFSDATSGNDEFRGYINYAQNTDALSFGTVSSERMRIDSSGNLLVGKTSSNLSTAGSEFASDGLVRFTRSNVNAVVNFNKKDNDGDIVSFRKDDALVGSIGVDNSDNLFIQGNSTHVGFQFASSAVVPHKNGATIDNNVNLGSASDRFKDLYLSGGAYIGGTGSANLLDDYEEGTWTPSFNGLSNTPSYNLLVGRYTKIGRFVSVHMTLQTNQAPTFTDNNGELQITGLPFAIDGGTYVSGVGAVGTQGFSFNGSNNSGNITGQLATGVNSSEQMVFMVTSSGSNRAGVKNVGITNGAIIETTICYTAT